MHGTRTREGTRCRSDIELREDRAPLRGVGRSPEERRASDPRRQAGLPDLAPGLYQVLPESAVHRIGDQQLGRVRASGQEPIRPPQTSGRNHHLCDRRAGRHRGRRCAHRMAGGGPAAAGGTARRGPQGQLRRDWKATVSGEQVPLVTSPDELAGVNLFDRLIEMRDLQRQRLGQPTFILRGDELPWELNAHGKMQWYLHPCIAYTAVQTHLFYRQEIAAGSRSGVQGPGGGGGFYILQGEGYTEGGGGR